MGEHLHVDAGLIHGSQANVADVIEAVEKVLRAGAFSALELGGELVIPIVFFERDDGMFLVHAVRLPVVRRRGGGAGGATIHRASRSSSLITALTGPDPLP